MEQRLIPNNHYAKAKYEDLRPKIEGMKIGGKVFEDCPRCHTSAYQVEEDAPRLTSGHCLVCFQTGKRLQYNCPECGDTNQSMEPFDGLSCTKCGHQISGESTFNLLDQNQARGTKHGLDSVSAANCDECQSYHAVCNYEDGYLCTNCFTYFDSVDQCEYCSDYMTGDTQGTYAPGGEHCDGAAGRNVDD